MLRTKSWTNSYWLDNCDKNYATIMHFNCFSLLVENCQGNTFNKLFHILVSIEFSPVKYDSYTYVLGTYFYVWTRVRLQEEEREDDHATFCSTRNHIMSRQGMKQRYLERDTSPY